MIQITIKPIVLETSAKHDDEGKMLRSVYRLEMCLLKIMIKTNADINLN